VSIVFVPTFTLKDPDAEAYIAAVEAADGEALEQGVRDAYTTFVVGCKDNGIWPFMNQCVLTMGARTVAGAKVPLKGSAPTTAATNYSRTAGLEVLANEIDTNYPNNTDPRNNKHFALYTTTPGGPYQGVIQNVGGGVAYVEVYIYAGGTAVKLNSSVGSGLPQATINSTMLIGGTRYSSSNVIYRINNGNHGRTEPSTAPQSQDIAISRTGGDIYDGRILGWSFGRHINPNLGTLETLFATLKSDIATALTP